MFSIGLYEWSFIVAVGMGAFAVAWFLGRLTDLPERRIVLISALPVPLLGMAIATFMVLSISMATEDECGVDACGMMAAAAITVIVVAIGIFLLNFLVAHFACRLARK